MSNEHLSERILNMEVSATIEMSSKSRILKSKGQDVISLSLGEPDFNTPEIIKDAAIKAIRNNYSKYPPIAGFQDLKAAISKKFKKENNITYKTSEIVVSTGAKQSLVNVILSLINPGDEVLLPTPYWVSYIEQVRLAGGVPIEIPTSIESNFKITPNQLEKAITNKSKILIYSSPCNPSGSLYSKEELVSLSEVILSHQGIYVLADEIYEYINFTNKPHTSIASLSEEIWERTVTVNGIAKGFAMTGYRIGYIGAPEWICNACTKIQGQFTSGANAVAQQATITAVEQGKDLVNYMVEAYEKRRNLVYELISKIDGIKSNLPEAAFYFFPDISYYFGKSHNGKIIKNAKELCLYILKEELLAIVPGEAFGSPNSIRISYATSEEILTEAIRRLKSALSKLN
ncbi:MAG: aspartate aminotransferase [Flavobacteriales bacterium]|nr:aspartate aminotransferase [Flavobacteriales bacterium]|tara:strand:+ start:5663 stop:6868 length:1206 start_codon:yes stop_codon:yes gene_type:complete